MEINQTEENNFSGQAKTENPQLIVTENMRSYIYDMAGWAKFLGILGFIFSGLMLLFGVFAGALIGAMGAASGPLSVYAAMGTGVLTFVFILYALLFLYPSLMLYTYAVKAKQGVLYGDQYSLEEGIRKLKSFFKFYGVLAIIFIALYGLIFLGGLLGGIAAA